MSSKTVEEAFEEWWRSTPASKSMPDFVQRAFAAGAAHGEAREREMILKFIDSIRYEREQDNCDMVLSLIECYIRQRGEKVDAS